MILPNAFKKTLLNFQVGPVVGRNLGHRAWIPAVHKQNECILLTGSTRLQKCTLTPDLLRAASDGSEASDFPSKMAIANMTFS